MSRSSLLLAATVALGAVSACSGGEPAPSQNSRRPQSQGGVSAEGATAGGPSATRIAELRRYLLGGSDVTGFGASKGRSYEYSVDRPCLKPTMQSAFPNHDQLGTTLAGTGAGQAPGFIAEEVVVFRDESTAKAAYGAKVAEFACPGGILRDEDGALPVTIGVPQEVSKLVGAPQATILTLTAPGKAQLVVVASQIQDMVVDLTFSASDPAGIVANPLAVARTAVGKLARS